MNFDCSQHVRGLLLSVIIAINHSLISYLQELCHMLRFTVGSWQQDLTLQRKQPQTFQPGWLAVLTTW